MIKNAFEFTLKSLFVLKILLFLSRLFGNVETRLDQKYKVNFKIYDFTTGKQLTGIHKLANISKSKNVQTMKFN